MALQPLAQAALTIVGMVWISFRIDPALALRSITIVPLLDYAIRYYATHIQQRLLEVGEPTVARNSANGPTECSIDVSASWMLDSLVNGGDRSTITVAVNNLTNRLNYAPFNGVLTSPFFGTANRALNTRRIVLTIRYDF
jgi:outer membrane receptor protein involved in Fe transport